MNGVAVENRSRVLVYKLGGAESLPPADPSEERELNPPPAFGTAKMIDEGRLVFHRQCQFCHGGGAVSGSLISDLRFSNENIHELWSDIVLGGKLKDLGMPSFDGLVTEEELESVRAYVLDRAHKEKAHRDAVKKGKQ